MKVRNVYQYFWAVAILFGFLACTEFISDDNSIFDVNVHDTYFVIAHSHLYTAFTIVYFTLGLIYKLSENILNKTLTAIHTIITVGSFIAYYILWAVTIAISNPEDVLDNSMEIFNIGITLIFMIAAATQVLLPVNIIIALTKRSFKLSR
ncbi:MAG: hypothetical protein DI539_14660 [Flavobacterium psychrophilum]|nr:MAG: hypothetical protein DI539_14660 [Flavobacterium psychrophilum]